jgi:GNAT superfamily N-acetyltransferase
LEWEEGYLVCAFIVSESTSIKVTKDDDNNDFPPTPAELPVGFATFKADGHTIDAMGTSTPSRGLGVGSSLVQYALQEVLKSKPDLKLYHVDSLIGAILFWRKMGFDIVKANEIPKSKLKDLEFRRPMVYTFTPVK